MTDRTPPNSRQGHDAATSRWRAIRARGVDENVSKREAKLLAYPKRRSVAPPWASHTRLYRRLNALKGAPSV